MASETDFPEEFFLPESRIGMTIDDRDYALTTEHAASSYGIPILVAEGTGLTYGAADILPSGRRAADAVRACGRYGALDLVPRFLQVVGLEPIATVDGRLFP